MAKSKKKDLKTTVEEGIVAILESNEEPSEGRMKALALGIKMCALNAKLEESDYGDFFNDGDPGGISEQPNGPKHPARKRTNGAGEPPPA